MPSKDLTIEIKADTKQALKEIEGLKQEIKGFGANVKKENAALKNQSEYLKNITENVTKLAAAFGAFEVAKNVVATFADFEQKMANLKAISGATGEEFKELEAKARELGENTIYTASQVADGMKYLAMAGYKTKDILASIGGILKLSQIGMIDLGQASDIVSNILTSFNLKASETQRVVDVMTATITNANTDIPEMGEAMKYVAGRAASLGISLEETSAALAVLADNGIKGTLAGTGLAEVLTRLSAPIGKAKDDLTKLGIEVYDAKGNFVGLKNVLIQLHDKLEHLSQKARNRYIQDIFGQIASKDAIFLIEHAKDEYVDFFNKISHSAGLADKKVKIMQDTLQAHWKELKSALSDLAIAIGKDLAPTLKEIVDDITKLIKTTDDFYEKNKSLIETIIELVAIYKGLIAVMTAANILLRSEMVINIARAVMSVESLKDAFILLRGAILGLEATNPVLLAIAATLGVILYEVNEYAEEINRLKEATDTLNGSQKDFNSLLTELKRNMDFSHGRGEIKATAKELKKLKKETQDLINANDKRIEKMKKLKKEGVSDNKAVEREIDELIERNKILHTLYKKLQNTKPYEGAKESAQNTKRAVEKLTKEQQKYLNNLKKDYQKRISLHSSMIEKLKLKEKELANRILQIQKELQEKLKEIENNRILAVESIENKIHNIQLSGASEYKKYIDTKQRADILYAKAKEELERGNFELAKHYMGEYESLVSSIANKEIKENGRVVISKKQANAEAVAGLKKLEGLTNEYYAKEKAQAKAAYNQKMQQLRAELTATKAQLQLEIQRLNLEKQMIELLTGKKVTIDTSSALNAIKNLDKEIKALDKQIKKPKKIKADTKEAEQKVNAVDKKINTTKGKIKVSADTKPALEGILEIDDKVNGKKEVIKYYADNTEAKEKLNEVNSRAKSLKPTVKVKSDVSAAISALNRIPKTITTIHYIKTVETHAGGGIAGFRRISGKIPGDDPLNSDDVPALLTRGEFVVKRDAVKHYGEDFLWKLNNKYLPKFATGGIVQRGIPDVISNNFSNSLSDVNNENGNTIDLSKFDDLIEKLNELKNTFHSGGNLKKANEITLILKNITDEKEKLKNANDRVNKDKKEEESYKNSVRGEILSKEQFSNYQNNLKKMGIKINVDTKELNGLNEKADEFIAQVKKKIEEFNNYLKQVENIKNKINAKFNEFGVDIPDDLQEKISKSLNLEKLQNFYNQLNNMDIPSGEEINKEYKNYIIKKLDEIRNIAYSPIGDDSQFFEMMTRNYKPNPFMFLNEIGIKNPSKLAAEIPVNFDYRIFGADYKLNDKTLKDIINEYLKERLPRFQTGGLLQLQNGGKLAGYGGGDRNLALLEDGEFVVRKEAVSHFGVNLFEKLNSLKLPKFQTGGYVGISSGGGARDVVDVNLNVGAKSYKMSADIDVAKQLTQELKRIM